jgi:hypothetical protein
MSFFFKQAIKKVSKLEDRRKHQLFDLIVKDDALKCKANVIPQLAEKKNHLIHQKEQIVNNKIINQSLLKHITVDDIFNILKNYLLFCTAKDCSIIMAFQEVNK